VLRLFLNSSIAETNRSATDMNLSLDSSPSSADALSKHRCKSGSEVAEEVKLSCDMFDSGVTFKPSSRQHV